MAAPGSVPALPDDLLDEVSAKLEKLLEKYSGEPQLISPHKPLSQTEKLLQPCILGFLTVQEYVSMRELSTQSMRDCEHESSEFYPSLWEVACSQYGLFHPMDGKVTLERLKTELWPHALKKWGAGGEVTDVKAGESFNVDVMARMRPGKLGSDKVNLPLHQFLKLKRMENLRTKKEAGVGTDKTFVGEADPGEVVCPFTEALMREPVLLADCHRV